MTGYLTIILYWRNKTKQNCSPSVFNIQAPTNPLSGARGLPEKIALESNILNRGRGVNMHYMYTLLCIRYKDHHSVLHHAFHYVNSLKVCIPHCSSTTATSQKTGDKSSLRCRFLCNSFTTVFKSSTRYIWRVNVHDMCFAWFSIWVPELCPFLKLSSI